MASLRNALLLGACYASSNAFTTPSSHALHSGNSASSSTTALHRNSAGFVGFSGDDNPNRGGGGGQSSLGGGAAPFNSNSNNNNNSNYSDNNDRRSMPMDDPFSSPRMMSNGPPMKRGPPPRAGSWNERQRQPPSVMDHQSNLSRRPSSYNNMGTSVNEDPRSFDMDLRFSQRPHPRNHPSMMQDPRQQRQSQSSWWESPSNNNNSSNNNNRSIQGGSRHTYSAPMDRDASHTFIESDGRPIDVEMELWDGPNNTPTRVKYYSEDGRMRPMNILTENSNMNMRGGTMSVRNTGSMEFPINAGVNSMMGGSRGGRGGPMQSPMGGMMDMEMDRMMMMGPRGSGMMGSHMPPQYLTEDDLAGFTRPSSPSMARGETVQGGALRTFPLDYSVEAVQVTITSDGLPVNAKVELWGTGTHVKQLAEVYNDDGRTRPFAAIVDVPGGSNTIAITNTGPMEYPIRVVVEPVGMMDDGWDGREESFGGHLAPW